MADLSEETINLIADRVAQRLLTPDFDNIFGTRSIKSLDVRRFAQFACALNWATFYNKHLYNTTFFPSYVDHVATMAR